MRDDRAVGGELKGAEVRPVDPPGGGGAAAEGCEASFGVEPFLPPHTGVLIGVSGRPRAQHFELGKRRHAARGSMSHLVGTRRSAAAGLRVETSLATHFAGVATGDAQLSAAVVEDLSNRPLQFERGRRPLQFHIRRCHALAIHLCVLCGA